MKIKTWLDSGANIHSCYSVVVDLEADLNITEKEWAAMSEDEKDDTMRNIAWGKMDWGWCEAGEDDE